MMTNSPDEDHEIINDFLNKIKNERSEKDYLFFKHMLEVMPIDLQADYIKSITEENYLDG